MDAQPVQREDSPTTKIISLVKFHATLATLLLTTTASTIPTPALLPSKETHHHAHHHHQNHHLALTNVLVYVHLWCATLGFAWWYAAQAAPDRQHGWVRAG
jgi:hypothetical protein